MTNVGMRCKRERKRKQVNKRVKETESEDLHLLAFRNRESQGNLQGNEKKNQERK